MRATWLIAAMAAAAAAAPAARAVELSFERDPSLPVVTIKVAVRAGAFADPEGKSGLTMFLSEMLLRGSQPRTRLEIETELDRLGASVSVDAGAEAVVFTGTTLSASLGPYLELLGETLTRPAFRDLEIRKLKSEAISRILERRSDDRTLAFDGFRNALFPGHPYGNPPQGRRADLLSITAADLRSHYANVLSAGNLVVAALGDAEESKLAAWAEGLGASLPQGAIEPPRAPSDPAGSTRAVIIDKPGRSQAQLVIGHLAIPQSDAAYSAFTIGNHVFGASPFSNRLWTEVREKRGLSYAASSSLVFMRDAGWWHIWAFPSVDKLETTLSLALEMIASAKSAGVTGAEHSSARDALIRSAGFSYDTPAKRAENEIRERIRGLPKGFFRNRVRGFREADLEDVNASLREHLRREGLTVVVVGSASRLRAPLAKSLGLSPKTVEVRSFTDD